MINIEIDGVPCDVDLRHCRAGWQWFNVIKDSRPVSQHSVPVWFFCTGGKVTTGGHVYVYRRNV